jgi:hypothetical protein
VCRRIAGAPTNVNADGNDGIDNNFGQHTMPAIRSVNENIERTANDEIASGGYTLLLRIDGVAANNAKAPGALFAVGPRTSPKFTAEDRWPVWSACLSDGKSLDKPLRTFPLGYVRDNTWVSGEIGEAPDRIWIPVFGTIEVQASALITLKLESGEGVLAGAIPRPEFVKAATPWIERFGMCPGTATFEQVAWTLSQSADLKLGAPDLQDPTVECDGISLAIGFTAVPVAEPIDVIPTPPPPTTLCK